MPTKTWRHWTPEADNFLRANYLSMTHAQLATVISHTRRATSDRCLQLGLHKITQTPARPYTEADIVLMRHWYATHPDGDRKRLAKKLKRGETSLGNKLTSLGLTKTNRPKSRRSRTQAIQTTLARHGQAGGFSRFRPYTRVARGKRDDLGDTYWRSSWEANYARYLNLMQSRGNVLKWEFEPQRFVFYGETRGPISYTPDFRITFPPDNRVAFHEVKGWMDRGSKSRIKRMRKHYPEIELVIIDSKAYHAIEKQFAEEIPAWEYPRRGKKPAPKKKYRNKSAQTKKSKAA